ncbi:SDR family NAD(P)-dependent oxidoreductase [Nocardia asteroides]|uniref:SDR family NAD(P)-dependent oxidoreductase n=1 Tax=Nocardia asteroides TaxID=1824 RepID=UPI001E42CA6E|nr:SDR family oxidoreductase [Nocardia asteroides]UGT59879.1 SDR family oxidoreductase [Nocardia asteroides]
MEGAVTALRGWQSSSAFFEEAVVAITGAGAGIGRALALELSRRGARLALADIDAEAVEGTRVACAGPHVPTVSVFDVGDRSQVQAYATGTVEHFGRIDTVINSAGVLHVGSVADSPLTDFDAVLRINFFGTVQVTKAFLPYLLDQGTRGRIVTFSSALGLVAAAGHGPYTSAKFAIRGFTEALRADLTGTEIAVVGVYPGGIRTSIARAALLAPGIDRHTTVTRFEQHVARTDPDHAARVVLTGVERGSARVLVGADAQLAEITARLAGARYERLIKLAGRLS